MSNGDTVVTDQEPGEKLGQRNLYLVSFDFERNDKSPQVGLDTHYIGGTFTVSLRTKIRNPKDLDKVKEVIASHLQKKHGKLKTGIVIRSFCPFENG